MADEDEIDILGDFSFNSCLAQNNQGIPSCSDREDTVHPQWLLDSISNNWYDTQSTINRTNLGPSRKLSGHSSKDAYSNELNTSWSLTERNLLAKEIAKYGRNVRKISQTIKTKTEAEIQALIEAELGINLETPSFGIDRLDEQDNLPAVVQEEIVADDVANVLNAVSTGSPTIPVLKKPFRKKNYNVKSKNSLLKPNAFIDNKEIDLLAVNPEEIFYEDDLVIGSTESIGSDFDSMDIVSRRILKQQEKMKTVKKLGNHRRKVSGNYDRGRPRNRSKELLQSPPRRQRKDSSLSDDSVKSPKMQIVFSSGHALPVSEGEQIIKIEKKKDSESESDIEIDIDSDNEDSAKQRRAEKQVPAPGAAPVVPSRKFEPMPKRPKKINLDGGGGYTIMHTAAGDLYALGAEPRRARAPRRAAVQLLPCRLYGSERPALYEVRLNVSALISMDAHAHTSRAEVMGLAGGGAAEGAAEGALEGAVDGARDVPVVTIRAYRPAAAAACGTHCDMDPVSQAAAAEALLARGLVVCAWHHSHPSFPPAPSALDLRSQRALQRALERGRSAPLLGLITSQHWPPGRCASQYRCIRVEDSEDSTDPDLPIGYQFSVKLVADLDADNLHEFLRELRAVLLRGDARTEYSVDMPRDVCPLAGITYLEKCISSISHHMRSAGYADDDAVTKELLLGIRDIFR